MDIEATAAQPEQRIKLRVDYSLKDHLSDRAKDFCRTVNEMVLPTLEALGLTVTKKALINAAASYDNLREIWISTHDHTAPDSEPIIKRLARREAATEFDELTAELDRWPDTTTDRPDLLKFTAGQLQPDHAAILEAATVYAKGAEIDAYKRHQKAVEALNEFFRGKAPNNLSNFFPTVDGKVMQGTTLTNYSYFV